MNAGTLEKKEDIELRRVRDDNALAVLVGNKVVLSEKREVSFEEGQEKGRELEALFCEVSVKHATNVHYVLERTMRYLCRTGTNSIRTQVDGS